MFEGFFAPRGVAVLGASQNPSKLGYGVARNMVVSNYPGALHFINPKGGQLFDRPIYPDVASAPDPIDLAVIIIPAKAVPGALEDCGQRGIHYAIVGSGGFRETGEEGAQLEQRCLEIAHKYDIRVLGPNCIGYLDTHLPIDTSFLPLPGPIQGDIAFLSHSGAICEAVIDWARGQGFGLSRLVSLGNQMDLTEADLLPPTGEDENTRVIAMYLEGVGDGSQFIEQARKVTPIKPVVAIKVGRSESGRAAVASHTGALAGQDAAYDAAFRKAGVIRARHSEEMFDWARALAWCQLPPGPRFAILTNAGGPGVIAADSLDENGLELTELKAETTKALQAILPEAASVRNPVDMLAAAGPREYADCLRILLDDEGVDGIIVIMPPPPMSTAAEVAGAIIPVIRSAEKPVVVTLMGEDLIAQAAQLLRQSRIPDYRFPERAASAMRVLWQRARALEATLVEPEVVEDVDINRVKEILQKAEPGEAGFISADQSALIAEAYGLALPPEQLVNSAEEAAKAASELGLPVALKIVSPDIPHKSDAGGVLLDLETEDEVARGYQQIMDAVTDAAPAADVTGVAVQPMIAEGHDVIVGVVRDDQFGPMVMFGTGGVEVEARRDVAFGLAPLTRVEAEYMLESTWAGRRLAGFRHMAAGDQEAAIQALIRLGQLMVDFQEIAEVEVNPLRVMEQGAQALDIRLRLRSNQ
jgi:acetyltransferase